MAIEQAILTWIHITCAAIWVGGSLFIGVVFAPILKKMSMPIEERLQLMIKVGRRFNKLAVPALIILMVTGIYQSHLILQKSDLLLESSYGNILVIKIILVVALIATFAIHVRVIRKDVEEKIMSKQISDNQLQVLRKKIIILGEITVVLSVIILFLAAVLNSGG
ncbi:MAG TPA: CopD family protein [Candidatus Nitrosopelagicus sp.]|nr:CopD family protein [Candidatus Nitrosopelagicus sp.]|tara:strand:- start:17 stop:511 length:495 start_codon:yes stop_codon:yes gene_type:complete